MISERSLPIRRLTLYKHGVAFVQRQGDVSGEEVRLVFRADEVNDALKSLLAIDRRGGQVLGIHYATPADEEARLRESPITLSDDHSLVDLLRSLRGWQVRLVAGDATQSQTLTGQLLGVDLAEERPLRDSAVALLDETSGAVLALPLRTVRQIFLMEERAQHDLRFFLETSRSEEMHRTVTVRLSAGDHDLAVSYLIPSPTWRVSYRLVAEAVAAEGEAATQGQPSGSLLLQGWGLFDNRLEEDLDGVSVMLVAGQPISFVYDLAASRIPPRPVVQDAARVAAGPVEFETPVKDALGGVVAQPAPAIRETLYSTRSARMMPMAAQMPAASIQQLAKQPAAAAGSELGELFQYDVVAPVTVRRGESALVPILSAQLPYRRELLFNERKLPDHPVAALRFANATGLVLERGPVTVLEDGAYHGEALVPFTRQDGEVYLAFSVELGIKIGVARAMSQETAGIRIAGALLEMKQATINRTSYRVESHLGTAQAVTIEHPLWVGADLVGTPAPEARTSEFYRWSVTCPPRRATTFTVAERRYDWQSSQLLDVAYANLQEFFRRRWLDAATLGRIRALLDERAAIARNVDEIGRLETERQEIYMREEQLRKNMAALGSGGEEGALRKQVVAQLQTSEDRLGALATRIAALNEENTRRQQAITAQLATIAVPDTSDAP